MTRFNSNLLLSTVTLVVFSSLLCNVVLCVPRRSVNETCEKNGTESLNEVYDQRQNGTENVRVNVKDVVLVWAPSDALLGASSFLDSDLLDYPNEEVPQKPIGSNEVERPTSILDILASFPDFSTSVGTTENKPENSSIIPNTTVVGESSENSNKVNQMQLNLTETPSGTAENIKRSKLKLSGLLLPFMRRKQHQAN